MDPNNPPRSLAQSIVDSLYSHSLPVVGLTVPTDSTTTLQPAPVVPTQPPVVTTQIATPTATTTIATANTSKPAIPSGGKSPLDGLPPFLAAPLINNSAAAAPFIHATQTTQSVQNGSEHPPTAAAAPQSQVEAPPAMPAEARVEQPQYQVAPQSIPHPLQPDSQISIPQRFLNLDEAGKINELRMSSGAFDRVLALIEDDPVFQNNSTKIQTPARFQLMVTLSRLAKFGVGSAIGRIAEDWGISEAAVHSFSGRVLSALNRLSLEVVQWPDAAERTTVSQRIQETSGFPNCVGFVGGTHVVLYSKPAGKADEYSCGERQWGLAALIVNDDEKRIRYTHVGQPGKTPVDQVLGAADFAKDPTSHFSPNQYLLAAGGITNTQTVLSSYEDPGASADPSVISLFNERIINLRKFNESTCVMLRARFKSLRGMRIMINNERSRALAVDWFRACCALHNLLLNDVYKAEWENMDAEEEEAAAARAAGGNGRGGRKRRIDSVQDANTHATARGRSNGAAPGSTNDQQKRSRMSDIGVQTARFPDPNIHQ